MGGGRWGAGLGIFQNPGRPPGGPAILQTSGGRSNWGVECRLSTACILRWQWASIFRAGFGKQRGCLQAPVPQEVPDWTCWPGLETRSSGLVGALCGGPSLQQRLCEERILTLGQVVEVCGPRLDNAAGLASCLSLRSVRVVSLLLQSWKQQLSQSELETAAQPIRAGNSSSANQSWKQQLSQSELALITAHCNGLKFTNDNDSFPEML
ncbi:hypothetical protein JOQ06_015155, partial [Pogonophryne albipinna]